MSLSLTKEEMHEILDYAWYTEMETCKPLNSPLIQKIKKRLGVKDMNSKQQKMMAEWADLRSPNTSAAEVFYRDHITVNGSPLEPDRQYILKAGDKITGHTAWSGRSIEGKVNKEVTLRTAQTTTMYGSAQVEWFDIDEIEAAVKVTGLNMNGSIQFVDTLQQVGSGPQTEREHANAHALLVKFINKWKTEICRYEDFLFYLQDLLEYKSAQYGHANPMKTWDVMKIKHNEVYNFVMEQKRRNRGVMPRKSWAKAQDLAQVMGEEEKEFNSWLTKIAS